MPSYDEVRIRPYRAGGRPLPDSYPIKPSQFYKIKEIRNSNGFSSHPPIVFEVVDVRRRYLKEGHQSIMVFYKELDDKKINSMRDKTVEQYYELTSLKEAKSFLSLYKLSTL